MKKKLLFSIDSLTVGGAEKSLITLLNLIDYSQYEVDLQLFLHGGIFEQFLPKEVNVLPSLNITDYLNQSVVKQMTRPPLFAKRMQYSLGIRKRGLCHADRACLYWKCYKKFVAKNPKHYDVALAYAQGVPTFYTVDKINADKKLGWVNVDYMLKGDTKEFQRGYYDKLNAIVPVSDATFGFFSSKVFPEFKKKMRVIWDINDGNMITRMSLIPSDKPLDKSLPVIMTTGRLHFTQKGYDLALEAAKILRDRGVNFRWYAVGEGPYRPDMEAFIAENNLEDTFILLGATANPYAYMRQCDIYVQPSRHEGFGLTIAEARILNRPVVCTNFDGCTMQMIDGKNGLISSFDPSDIADKIQQLMNDKDLYNSIQQYQKQEKKGNTEELEKFYDLIEG